MGCRGCNLRDSESIEKFLAEAERKKTNIRKHQEARVLVGAPAPRVQAQQKRSEAHANGDVAPAGKGAQFALARLERVEAESFGRLQEALTAGVAAEIEQCQLFWLRATELLRKLDLSIELARRDSEQMVPLRVAQDVVTAASEWMRISITCFLSAESPTLMGGFKNVGEFKLYFIERLRGILDLTLKGSLKTRSAVPEWALQRIKEAWNVSE